MGAWEKQNPVLAADYQRAWHRRNPEKAAAKSRRWRDRHPGAQQAQTKKRYDLFRDRIRAIKMESGCVDCGYIAHASALEFDHMPGTDKLFTISSSSTRPWADVVAEMLKCEIVCANCHRIRTAARLESLTLQGAALT